MISKSAFLVVLVASALPAAAIAQPSAAAPAAAAGAPASAPATPTAPQAAQITPTAYPAKIALIAFEQAVVSTNEGQQMLATLQKKYAPQKAKLDQLAGEIDSMKKQLQSAPATMTDEQRSAKLKEIDTKDKQYQREAEDASQAYNAEAQEALSKVMQKVNLVVQDYVKKNGYTLLLDVGGQQSPVMWTSADPNADITQAVVEAYNTSSGIAPPAPTAPAATTHPRPATIAPHTTPAPKPSSTK